MWYVIMGWDEQQSEQIRHKLRDEHIQRLEDLKKEGRLLLAGPMPLTDNDDTGEGGMRGSLIVAEFGNLEQAKSWAKEDPYKYVYKKVEIFPFIKRLP